MIDFILVIGGMLITFIAFWAVGCVIVKICFKIADVIFGN